MHASVHVCVRVCMCARVRVYMLACVRARVRAASLKVLACLHACTYEVRTAQMYAVGLQAAHK